MMSPTIRTWMYQLAEAEHRLHHAEGDDASNQASADMQRLTLALAREPALCPADSAAKLRTLLTRLRLDLSPDNEPAVTNYLLAESALAGFEEQAR